MRTVRNGMRRRACCRFEPLEARVLLHAGHDHTPEAAPASPSHADEHEWSLLEAGRPVPAPPMVVTDSATQGEWGQSMTWPGVAIHAHLLPSGKVLFWGAEDRQADTQIWDPVTNEM